MMMTDLEKLKRVHAAWETLKALAQAYADYIPEDHKVVWVDGDGDKVLSAESTADHTVAALVTTLPASTAHLFSVLPKGKAEAVKIKCSNGKQCNRLCFADCADSRNY